MSVEDQAHQSYLVMWAFLMVARIVLVTVLGSVGVGVVCALLARDPAGLWVGLGAQPFLVAGTIYFSSGPKATTGLDDG